jgi:alpha-ketoglutarate-dependent taurine dioxygenase
MKQNQTQVSAMRISAGDLEFVPQLTGATCRELEFAELSFQTSHSQKSFPLVIEPVGTERNLQRFLLKNSTAFQNLLRTSGHILLRGWDVQTEVEFEKAIFSLKGLKQARTPLMLEPGRDLVPGTNHVYYTNTKQKTGGSFQLPGNMFHSESFYHDEVPNFMFFWSKKASVLGGETAVVQMSDAYERLSQDLKNRLESDPCLAIAWPLAHLASVYSISSERLEKILETSPYEIRVQNGNKFAVLFKPGVFRNRATGRTALQINFRELPEMSQALCNMMLPFYRSPIWLLHRMAWNYPEVMQYLSRLDRFIFSSSGSEASNSGSIPRFKGKLYRLTQKMKQKKVVARLLSGEANLIAASMFEACTVFPWKTNDILCIDNTQVLHCGMPGLGKRELRVILANSLPFDLPFTSGVASVKSGAEPSELSLRERILAQTSGVKS